MSEKLGNVDMRSNYDALSTRTKETIESEVRRLIEEGRARATKVLTEHRNELDLLAKALIEYETLDREEAFKVIKGEKLTGRRIMPSTTIKLPDMLPPSGGLGAGLPDIPGSAPAPEQKPPRAPPAGATA